MNLVCDDSRIFSPMFTIVENTVESSETKFMNFSPYVFDVDYLSKIRSELSVIVLKKMNKIPFKKVT